MQLACGSQASRVNFPRTAGGCAGLERNKFDGEKCADFFETYKQCKKQEVTLCAGRRTRVGQRPARPPADQRLTHTGLWLCRLLAGGPAGANALLPCIGAMYVLVQP